jgi:hypothetical protein
VHVSVSTYACNFMLYYNRNPETFVEKRKMVPSFSLFKICLVVRNSETPTLDKIALRFPSYEYSYILHISWNSVSEINTYLLPNAAKFLPSQMSSWNVGPLFHLLCNSLENQSQVCHQDHIQFYAFKRGSAPGSRLTDD